jgi:hypothetical protein
LLVNLAPLALLARLAHGCHVHAHALPHKTCRQHALCSAYAWMCLVVDGVEHSWSTNGTSGLLMPRATSHSRLAPSTCTVLTDREEDLAACSVLGQAGLVGRHLVEGLASRRLHICHAHRHARNEGLACLPARLQPETRRVLLHRLPPREAYPPPHVQGAWREYQPPRCLPR